MRLGAHLIESRGVLGASRLNICPGFGRMNKLVLR